MSRRRLQKREEEKPRPMAPTVNDIIVIKLAEFESREAKKIPARSLSAKSRPFVPLTSPPVPELRRSSSPSTIQSFSFPKLGKSSPPPLTAQPSPIPEPRRSSPPPPSSIQSASVSSSSPSSSTIQPFSSNIDFTQHPPPNNWAPSFLSGNTFEEHHQEAERQFRASHSQWLYSPPPHPFMPIIQTARFRHHSFILAFMKATLDQMYQHMLSDMEAQLTQAEGCLARGDPPNTIRILNSTMPVFDRYGGLHLRLQQLYNRPLPQPHIRCDGMTVFPLFF